MAQTQDVISKKTIIIIVAVLIVVIVGLGFLRVKKQFMQQNQYANPQNTSTNSLQPTSEVNNNNPSDVSNAQLDKDVQDIQDSLNKLDVEQNNIDQGLNGQSQDNTQ